MYSTKCSQCGQLITLKADEMRAAITEAEAHNHAAYQMACPKCRRPVKIAVKTLKMKLPRPVVAPPTEGDTK
jgi:phage terminase large subunit GpA-like protein